MKTTKRFDDAVMKLYDAFHENRLKGLNCSVCAVGNICDNSYVWDYLPIFASTLYFSGENIYLDNDEDRKEAKKVIKKSGYSAIQLQKVEMLFLTACDFKNGTKEQQFKGLCAVVEYLAELDNIPNPMDYTKLFETENDKPKYQLV